jgi:LSD1 subclass zinc finger protein
VESHVEDLPLDSVSMLVDERRSMPDESPPVAAPIPLAKPTASAPLARPVAPIPIQPLAPPPVARPVAPIPVVQPVAPIPLAQPVAPPPVEKVNFVCASCQAPLRMPMTQKGKRVRCPRCQTVVIVPEA